jgi:hypothetical protein
MSTLGDALTDVPQDEDPCIAVALRRGSALSLSAGVDTRIGMFSADADDRTFDNGASTAIGLPQVGSYVRSIGRRERSSPRSAATEATRSEARRINDDISLKTSAVTPAFASVEKCRPNPSAADAVAWSHAIAAVHTGSIAVVVDSAPVAAVRLSTPPTNRL